MRWNMEFVLKPAELGIIICAALFVGAHVVYWPLLYKHYQAKAEDERLEKLKKDYNDE